MTQSDIIQALERVREALESMQLYTVPDTRKGVPPHIANDLIVIERVAEKALNDFPALLEAVKELQQDNVGYLMVAVVANNLDQHKWEDEWLEFYKPEKWLGSHRAAAVFLTEKFKELQAVLEERATQVSALTKALEYQQAKLDAALQEPSEAEICIVANGLFRGIKPYEQAKASLTNFIKGRFYKEMDAALDADLKKINLLKGWESIETAPKAETILLIDGFKRIGIGQLYSGEAEAQVNVGGDGWAICGAYGNILNGFTHWMRLPKPPEDCI